MQYQYFLSNVNSHLWVLDETLICGIVGGNKLRKLEYILNGKNPKGIITMGSVYSSHCMAVAYWGIKNNIPVHLIIICDKQHENTLNKYPYLILCRKLGAKLNFISDEKAHDFIENYKNRYSDFLWIPGGGHTREGLEAYKDLFLRILKDNDELHVIDWILLPYGTGTTAFGIVAALNELNLDIRVIGVSVSRNKERCLDAASEFLEKSEMQKLLINDRFAGRYGRRDDYQNKYFKKFFKQTGIMADPIYNIRSIEYYYDEKLSNGLIINTGGTGNLYL
ncbi:MAG: pyridoxal-phosphate dependent enzyme [Spirochaetales bacterium]|nr:pyridoxal-phosphate dependent enzyme [Spirochaetales bacterium]